MLSLILSPQQATERAAHQRTTDRSTDRAADRLAEVGDHAADHLPGRHAAALDVGAEDRGGNRADVAEDTAALAATATATATIRRRSRAGEPLLDDLVGGFGVDSGIVFALDRA